ncbi:hypothetical protein Barba19A_gp102 [Rheinheimera phage vB_RspM_Barba19A]|jgi:hypothetical protein|uniref:Uncharacterized protein n=2 Tax=Barbavirus barba19A TaxID=2734091 RepID=A0A4P8N6H0_9CAUD|nr:hypothetical protein HOV47_gp102 [Rheinheimera phage vB_RspM_Barba19A]QCQ61942.1 hypothetical protein Barba19A_gp102 [Rheinheimera phage vB_RspM_Barba19A]QCQ64692.1 hypothetical protein Barba31A_gp102 [Rheinheimera phage vB_RspM_Barba31A]
MARPSSKKVSNVQPKMEVSPQPVQMKFLKATESIVFFGGGAKPKLVPL